MDFRLQAPLSLEFSKQEYWSWVAISSCGDLPTPEIKPTSPVSPTLAGDSLPLSHMLSWELIPVTKSLVKGSESAKSYPLD